MNQSAYKIRNNQKKSLSNPKKTKEKPNQTANQYNYSTKNPRNQKENEKKSKLSHRTTTAVRPPSALRSVLCFSCVISPLISSLVIRKPSLCESYTMDGNWSDWENLSR